MAQISAFSGWEDEKWDCPGCKWSGTGSQADLEVFEALTELNCPVCDSRLALIQHPTRSQIQTHAIMGNKQAIEMLAEITKSES